MRHRYAASLFTAALAIGCGAHAADLSIELRDLAGRPIEDAVAWLEPATSTDAQPKPTTGSIRQIDRDFAPTVSVFPVGTAVDFPNEDTVLHHVYSFSPTKSFEIKLYKGKPSAPVIFDKPGVVSIGCNIHDWMQAFIVIVPTRWFGKSGASGGIDLAALPADGFKLHVWHPRLASPEPVRELRLAAVEHKSLRLSLRLLPAEHRTKPAETTY